VARYPTKHITPFVMGGFGTYTMLLDTQINGKAAIKNAASYTVGGGVWIKFTERSGIQIDARQLTMRNFDRGFLDPCRRRSAPRATSCSRSASVISLAVLGATKHESHASRRSDVRCPHGGLGHRVH